MVAVIEVEELRKRYRRLRGGTTVALDVSPTARVQGSARFSSVALLRKKLRVVVYHQANLPAEIVQTPVYTATNLTNAAHTLTVESTGQKNVDAFDYAVVVDAFDVTPGSPPTTVGTRIEDTVLRQLLPLGSGGHGLCLRNPGFIVTGRGDFTASG